ncbi:hypothetical protein [Bacillus cereus]|uniref:hypothetical protein n=1 Tax=Bacillus cereus TaxID=1396 RepID=UPI00211D7BC9|nr:hypothetical protein [Bacillus cereus]
MDLTFALGLPFLRIDFSATIGPILKIGVVMVILELIHKSIHADYVYFEKIQVIGIMKRIQRRK